MTAQGNLNKTNMGLATSIERLSSGLRINRGADDAAGLTISEKLRGQIRGLNRAILNAQDGISLIQTAEGALSEDASILNRMRELAIQSQDDALTTNDRLEIQKEVDQLVDEVDRIARSTEFNTKKLLDGSANSLTTASGTGIKIFQVGDSSLAAGDYNVTLRKTQNGTRQAQASNILTDRDTGSIAASSTQLQDVASFYDAEDNNVLAGGSSTLTLRGNGAVTTVNVSQDMTLSSLASALESAITTAKTDGGLGLTGSAVAFNSSTGQILLESGREGVEGEIAIAGEEGLLIALGIQTTVESSAAAFTVTAGNIGTGVSTSAGTTSNRAAGVLEGLTFQFDEAASARVDGTVQGSEVIVIGNTNVVFTLADTNSASQHSTGASGRTARITVTLTAGRTYTKTSIANIINAAVAVQPVASRPQITASFSGYDLQLTSGATGSSAAISILANTAATDVLGISSGIQTGSGGTAAKLTGTADVSGGITIGAQNIRLTVHDGDLKGAAITAGMVFRSNTVVSALSLTTAFNTYFTNNSVAATASINASGQLELTSTQTGTDSRLSLFSNLGSLTPLGLTSGSSNTGSGGNAAVLVGRTAETSKDIGFTFSGATQISIQDASGASSGAISLIARPGNGALAGTAALMLTTSYTMSKQSIEAKLDASALGNTDVGYEFDAGGRLDFYSRSAGRSSRIVLSTHSQGATPPTQAQSIANGIAALGINFSQAAQGSGDTSFRVHVADRSLNFQVGANAGQAIQFGVINTSAEALGLVGLDVTNVRSATRALATVDSAVNLISSERSKLGSLQNRLNSTVNNLTVTSTNLQATESKIRDVDVAMETVMFTRNQILLQAGVAQLAQAKALPQQALQLLG